MTHKCRAARLLSGGEYCVPLTLQAMPKSGIAITGLSLVLDPGNAVAVLGPVLG